MTTKGTTYLVSYEVIDTGKLDYAPGVGKVFLSEEYGSTFEDIRKMLAIPRGLKAENIYVKSLMEMPK